MNEIDQMHLYPEELEYTSDSCSVYFDYTDEQIFKLRIIGQLDEDAVKSMVDIGKKIYGQFKQIYPRKSLYFIVDANQIRGITLKASKEIVRYKSAPDVFLVLYSIPFTLKRHLAYISLNRFKRKNIEIKNDETDTLLYVFQQIGKNVKEANVEKQAAGLSEKSESRQVFERLWSKEKKMISIGGYQYRRLMLDDWQYTARDERFHVNMSVIEGNIVLINFVGFAYPIDIDRTYDILGKIIETMHFDEKKNKIYSINDLRKMKGITLKARKKTTLYEVKFQRNSHILISIPSPLAGFLIKMLKKLYPKQYKLWVIMRDLEESFNFLKKYHSHNLSIDKKYFEVAQSKDDELEIPDNKKDLVALVKKQHKALQEEKKKKERQLETLQKITGHMSFSESFDQLIYNETSQSEDSLFSDVLKTIKLLQDDFKEIMRERDYQTRLMRESEEKYRSVVDLASDIIAMIQDGKIVLINNAATSISGYTRESLLFKPFHKFVERPDTYKRLYRIFLNSEQKNVTLETNFISRDNKLIPVSVSAGKIIYKKKPAIMIIARDITERKRNEAELEKHRKNLENLVEERTSELLKAKVRAEESDKLKSAFLANMSHEIRTPMNAIIGFSSLLEDQNLGSDEREYYIELIRSNGQSLLHLVDDIINLAKIEAGQQEVNPEYFDLKETLSELYSNYQAIEGSKEEHKNIDFRFNFKLENNQIKSDKTKLIQIVRNLLSNAFKFTEKGFIELGVERKNGDLLISVKDTGIGLSNDEQKVVFERFRKASNTVDKIYGGTGLGLSISKGLAELLNGELFLESEKGSGSSFFLRLPILDEEKGTEARKNEEQKKAEAKTKSSKATRAAEKNTPDWNSKKILLVEDTYANFLFVKAALQPTGVELVHCESGEQGLDYFVNNHDLDLVLMDIRLPSISGHEVAEQMHQMRKDLPIIAQTAYAMKGDKEIALSSGCIDYISKPMSPDDLIAIIEKHMPA